MRKFLLSLACPLAAAASPALAQIQLEPLGQYAAGTFGQVSAEISAFDPVSRRLFVTNATANTMDVVDLANPLVPTKLFSLDMAAYGAGVNSVAVAGGIVAVAIEGTPKTSPGTVVFLDTAGTFLSQVTVGALPDMLTFSPSGSKVLVANEGEPSDDYTVDPEGSISIIDLAVGVTNLTQADVATAGFATFNGVPLDPSIRIFGPGATVAMDLEPEYIVVSPDGATAWVSLQENNALALVDVNTATVTALLPLGNKRHNGGLQLFDFASLPTIGSTAAGEAIELGGFSGLTFEGVGPTGGLRFATHGDRGPNGEPKDVDGDGIAERPFALPGFQPAIVRFEVFPDTGAMNILEQIPLTNLNGTPLSGLPNRPGPAGLALSDEEPVDLFGQPLPLDPFGLDLEGIVRDDDGYWWACEEYRPSIVKLRATGQLIERYVPRGSNKDGIMTGYAILPAVYAQRRANRGFEAIAIDGGKIYAFVQSPLDNPDLPSDNNSKASLNVRILEFDPQTETTTGQFLYRIEGAGSDKIGDAVRVGPGCFWLIERDDAKGLAAKKKVFEIDLAGATNLHNLADSIVGPGGTLELMSLADLNNAGIVPVKKTLALDFAAAGYDRFDKPEGLAFIGDGRIALLNDNDYKLQGGFDQTTGLLTPNPDPSLPVLALIDPLRLSRSSIDASDKDKGVRVRNWPVLGMYQPDGLATFRLLGADYLVTANEGDARDYDAFAEEQRVKDLVLDPLAFPNAAALKSDPQLGRLTVTSATGDLDGDNDIDQLHVFGARSISIRDAAGALVWDSGDMLERITAQANPTKFNSNNDSNNSFDTRSDNKGPEPEGVAVGEINGKFYAFVCLERDSGVVAFDVTNPVAPTFVQYITTRDFNGNPAIGTAGDLGPEGIVFVPAAQSPTNEHLLIVSYEVSGSVRIFRIKVL